MYRFVIVGIILALFFAFTISYQIIQNKCENQGRVVNSSWSCR